MVKKENGTEMNKKRENVGKENTKQIN